MSVIRIEKMIKIVRNWYVILSNTSCPTDAAWRHKTIVNIDIENGLPPSQCIAITWTYLALEISSDI